MHVLMFAKFQPFWPGLKSPQSPLTGQLSVLIMIFRQSSDQSALTSSIYYRSFAPVAPFTSIVMCNSSKD